MEDPYNERELLLSYSINEEGPTKPEKGCYIPRRYIVALLLFLGGLIGYALRVVLSVAIIVMAKESTPEWSESIQGVMLSSFFWGYICTQIPSGALQLKYGPHKILGFGILFAGASSALTPLASKSVPLLIALRVCTGLGEGAIFTCIHTLCTKWIPIKERAFLLNIIWGGLTCGTAVATALTPIIINHLGWPSTFYIYGSSGIVWTLIWFLFGASSPEEMYYKLSTSAISMRHSELIYIQIHTDHSKKEVTLSDVPWKQIFKSSAMWALIIAHFVHNWGYYVLLTWMPKYLKSLNFDIHKNGLYAVLPYLTQMGVGIIFGKVSDIIVQGKYVSTRNARKIFLSIGFLGPAIFLATMGFRIKGEQDGKLAVGLLCGALGIASASASGYGVNHMDIGPKYAGILISVTNTVATIPGIVGVYLTGFILDASGGNWLIVWMLASSLFVAGAIVFSIFGKGEKQFD